MPYSRSSRAALESSERARESLARSCALSVRALSVLTRAVLPSGVSSAPASEMTCSLAIPLERQSRSGEPFDLSDARLGAAAHVPDAGVSLVKAPLPRAAGDGGSGSGGAPPMPSTKASGASDNMEAGAC